MTRTTPAMFAAATLLAGAVSACGAAGAATVEDMAALQGRVEELERANGRARMQIGQMEDQIFLLQDRVEAYRLAMQRTQDPSQFRDVVTIGVGRQPQQPVQRQPVAAQPYQSMPTASAPVPYPDIDPLAQLPVQRLAPADGEPVVAVQSPEVRAPVANDEPEVFITMETYAARFAGEEGGSVASSGGSGARSATAPRTAQPPVDVGNHRLPVDPSGPTSVQALPAPPAAVPVAMVQPSDSGQAAVSPLATYRTALDEFNRGEYARALESLQAFLQSGPAVDYMDNTLFWMGECYYGLGEYDAALGFFQRVVSEYPDGNKVPDSLLKVALTYERLQNVASAREVLTVLTQTYPNTDAAQRANERLRSLE